MNFKFYMNWLYFFLRLDLLYKTRRCHWDLIEQNNYSISLSSQVLPYKPPPSNSHFAELSKNQILILAIHTIDKISLTS